MSLHHSPRIVTSGLTFCVDPANVKSYPGSGTTVTDTVGRSTGSLINGTTFASSNQGAFVFDAVDDQINNFSAPIGLSTSRSICFTYKTNTTNRVCPVANRDSNGWFVCINRGVTGSISYNHASAGGNESLTSAAVVTTNTWYHVGITYDAPSNTAIIYLNGVSIVSANNISGMLQPASNGTIGTEPNSLFFDGQIGPVYVYNRALSNTEIVQNFNAVRGRYGI